MVEAAQNLSVYEQLGKQRRERLAGAVGLIVLAAGFAIAFVLFNGPLPLVIALAALICATVIVLRPRLGLYFLLFSALLIEQWAIVGLSPLTGILAFYQTLSGSSGIPLVVSPVEMVLLLTLAAVMLPHVARRGAPFVRGPLFMPLIVFLAFVVASLLYGLIRGGGAGPFDPRAAWEETRSFFYLGVTYVLTCNLIKTRTQLQTFVWLFIAAMGIKSVQGIVRYIDVRTNAIQVDTITGHEDVVFFAAFILLLAALLLFGGKLDMVARRQMRTMFFILPPLVFTLLETNRRLGFVVLAVGLGVIALLMLRTRRDLFVRIVPLMLVGIGIYVILFWNNSGALGEPIRAVRSLFAPETLRDQLSNAWRVLENTNIDYNIRSAPITGIGFGRPFSLIVAQPSLEATGFTYWQFIAHNAIYWVWMKMGVIGFILFWNLLGSAAVLGFVTFRRSRDGYLKALALLVAGLVLMQVIFSYGDLGLTYSRSMIFLGCMLGLLARLPAIEASQEATTDVRQPARSPVLSRIGRRTTGLRVVAGGQPEGVSFE